MVDHESDAPHPHGAPVPGDAESAFVALGALLCGTDPVRQQTADLVARAASGERAQRIGRLFGLTADDLVTLIVIAAVQRLWPTGVDPASFIARALHLLGLRPGGFGDWNVLLGRRLVRQSLDPNAASPTANWVIVSYLAGGPTCLPDEASALVPAISAEMNEHLRERLVGALSRPCPVVALMGTRATMAPAFAVRAFRELQIEPLVLDARRWLTVDQTRLILEEVFLDAILQGHGLVVGPADHYPALLSDIARTAQDVPAPVVIYGHRPFVMGHDAPAVPCIDLCDTTLEREARGAVWRTVAPGTASIGQLGLEYSDIVMLAEECVTARISGGSPDVRALARRRLSARWPTGVKVVDNSARLDDLVIPRTLRGYLDEICWRAAHLGELENAGLGGPGSRRRGVAALFAGEPGTGKTLAAEAVATQVGLPLLLVNLAQVYDKYVGETEKQLERIFDAVAGASAVVLFDEAEVLFGARTSVSTSNDRFANLQTAYLLQTFEEFEGLSLLSSNKPGALDAAFARRLDYILRFPMPGAAERLTLWRSHLGTLPLGRDVDLRSIAQVYEISGGIIRNSSIRAGSLALAAGSDMTMNHLLTAIDYEYAKARRNPVEFPGLAAAEVAAVS